MCFVQPSELHLAVRKTYCTIRQRLSQVRGLNKFQKKTNHKKEEKTNKRSVKTINSEGQKKTDVKEKMACAVKS